jgi:acyl-CoA hydrolase
MNARYPAESSVETTHMVLPGDTNVHGTAFGGKIMQWMDIASAVAATRHCGGPVVTVALDDLQFSQPIRMGDVVIMKACVNFAGRTSMEVGVRVDREDSVTRKLDHCLSGYFTFVAVDPQGRPREVPAVEPRTAIEQRRFVAARERRDRRLARRAPKS